MSQEVVTVLKIETGKSENNIKAIKKEIADLKKTLETAEIGTEAFEKASVDLATAQEKLKSVMAQTKQTVQAADGSYDALVQTMAKLKKEWRSTADEAKRNDIGKQIDAINNELKELDATIGNNQRNVGNYTDSIVDAYREIQGEVKKTNTALASVSKPIEDATDVSYDYGKAWSEVQKSTEQTRAKFESVQKMASGVASGFAAVQGAAALLGDENEELQKTFLKVQSAMAIAQGIGGLKDLIEGFSQAKTAFRGATMGLKTFTAGLSTMKKALISTGIGALVVAVGTLIAKWEDISKLWKDTNPQKEAAKRLKDIRLEVEKLSIQSSTEHILRVKQLAKVYADLGDNLNSKQKFVSDYAEELRNMGIKMNDVNDAERIFKDDTKEYCDAIKARAKAEALRGVAATQYAEKMEEIAELQSEIKTAQENLYEYGAENQTWYQKVDAYLSRRYGKTMPESQKEDAQALINSMKDEIVKLQKEADSIVDKLFAEATKQDSIADVLLETDNTSSGSSSSTSSSTSSTDDPAALAKKIAERAKHAIIDTKEEELVELTRIYNEELALLQQHNIATGDLTKEYLDKQTELLKEIENFEGGNEQEQLAALENFYNERIRIYTDYGISTVELTAQWESEKNAIIQDFENKRKDTEKTLRLSQMSDKEQELYNLQEEYNVYLELFKNHKEQMLLVEQWYKNQQEEIDKKYKEKTDDISGTTVTHKQTIEEFIDSYGALYKKIREDGGETAAYVAVSFTEALNSASQILGALQASIDTTTEEGFEKSKKYQIAQASINIAQGILSAISSAMSIPPPMGPILGAINAATVTTVGGIQIANIKKQKFDNPSSPTDVGAGVTPSINIADAMPVQYTKELMSDTETAELNKGNRVYVVESDITETQENVAVKESNSSF